MMTWNHRVCKEIYSAGTQDEEVCYSIKEVYYDDGKITGVTENAVGVAGDSVAELKIVLERMLVSLNKDVINLDALGRPIPEWATGVVISGVTSVEELEDIFTREMSPEQKEKYNQEKNDPIAQAEAAENWRLFTEQTDEFRRRVENKKLD